MSVAAGPFEKAIRSDIIRLTWMLHRGMRRAGEEEKVQALPL